jgi:hypothetical protein
LFPIRYNANLSHSSFVKKTRLPSSSLSILKSISHLHARFK